MHTIEHTIKVLRLMHNFTQKQMAEKIGMFQSTYCRLEASNRKIDFEKIEKIEKIGEVLNMSAKDIINYREKVGQDGNNHPLNGSLHQMNPDIQFLQHELKEKDKQIEHKDYQIESLLAELGRRREITRK